MKLYIKIGTLPADHYPMCKRRPRDGAFPAIRRAPEPGDCFYVFESLVPVPLRCTHIKPQLGLIYAERF